MAVTMKDIAEITGVSIATVDRALKNRGRINPDVAARIRKVAEELNYKTNNIAKSLSIRNRQLKIAIVLHVQHTSFFDEVEKGIQKAQKEIEDYGITVQIYRSKSFNAEDQLKQINLALSEGASGLILVPIDHELIIDKIIELHNSGFPVVFLSNFLDIVQTIPSVRCDYIASGRIAAGLIRLLSQGHGDILVFSNSFSMLGHKHRIAAFSDTLARFCPDMHISSIIELPSDIIDTYQTVYSALKTYPCQYVLFSGNSQAGLKAIQDYSNDIVSVFYDLTEVTKQALIQEQISAVIDQTPIHQGHRAVMMLFEHLTTDTPLTADKLISCQILLKESFQS